MLVLPALYSVLQRLKHIWHLEIKNLSTLHNINLNWNNINKVIISMMKKETTIIIC